MVKKILIVIAVGFCSFAVLALLFPITRIPRQANVLAAAQEVAASRQLQSADGGMAPYVYAIRDASTLDATSAAFVQWNGYLTSRSSWALSSAILNRVATADWNARLAGAPTITAQQLALAATNLINSKLNSMTLDEQRLLYKQMITETTPKGRLGLNTVPQYVTATAGTDGRATITIDPAAFTSRKSEFNTFAPGMLSSYTNFYPREAVVVLYSLASGDMGFGDDFVSKCKRSLADLTGLDMSTKLLYGENGYLVRRPLNTFLTDDSLSSFLNEIGVGGIQ